MLSRVAALVAVNATAFFVLSHLSVGAQIAKETSLPNRLVGDEACAVCHAALASTYNHTAHHLTSQIPSSSSILGSFTPAGQTLVIAAPADPQEPHLSFKMEARPDGFYQTAQADRGDQHLTRTERIDLVLGNGTRGQTYLFWKQQLSQPDRLFELPVSYWSDGSQWINSPGYRDGTANFARHVNARCMECHATFIKALSNDPQSNDFDRSTLIPGISCETCHGPGGDHIAAQHPNQTPAASRRFILNPAHFSRDRQIDLCALCHNGATRAELAPAFNYVPGQDLSLYLAPSTLDEVALPEVHGNQVGLLKRSSCFRTSPAMTCSTCHNTHAPGRTLASYSATCLQCHKTQSCPESAHIGPAILTRCIGCHMPLIQTVAIVSETGGRTLHTSIRSHWIKVYPANLRGPKQPQ